MSTTKIKSATMAVLRGDMNEFINRVYFLKEELVIKRYKRNLCMLVNHEEYIKMKARLEELEALNLSQTE